uniref:Uncharacterized protein n=1 Tax=Populus trichocarpa TaxID=3694 RepID=A0A2K2ATM0_POPTR
MLPCCCDLYFMSPKDKSDFSGAIIIALGKYKSPIFSQFLTTFLPNVPLPPWTLPYFYIEYCWFVLSGGLLASFKLPSGHEKVKYGNVILVY